MNHCDERWNMNKRIVFCMLSLIAACACSSLQSVAGLLPCSPIPWSGYLCPDTTSHLDSKEEKKYRSTAELEAEEEKERQRGIYFLKLVRGNPARKEIALTFDDGPHPQYTPRLLDILRREKVRATFFVVGKMVDKYPQLVQQEIADGHEVANHTYHHLRLPTLSPEGIARELRSGSLAIARAIGSTTNLFRPPGGEYDERVIAVVKRLGYAMVLWTDDPGDFAKPGAKVIEQRTLGRVRNGAIILLHDGSQQTLEVLPNMLRRLKAQGYSFVTCSEMAQQRGIITTGGPRVFPPNSWAGSLRRTLHPHLAKEREASRIPIRN